MAVPVKKRRLPWPVGVAIALVATDLALLVFDTRLLYYERKVQPGESYIVEEWGDLGKAQAPQLVCKYFTGRSTKTRVLWYSPNNIMGRDQCPFLDGGSP